MGETVSDIISNKDIKSWEQGDVITITAGVGKGKSYFVMNKLYDSIERFPFKGKILFLIHRNDPKEQFQGELIKGKKTDLIDLKTYQHIEEAIINKKGFDFSEYQYIVMDEFHRFLSDSFTATTDISLNAIMKQDKAIKIMMSATGNYMMRFFEEYMKLKTKDYAIPLEFSFIKSLSYYKSDETLERLVDDAIQDNIKTIVFIDSVRKAYELHKKFKDDTLFNCSTTSNQHGYGKYVDQEKISSMLKNSKFEETVLITTTVMDTGVSLKDKKLTQVICDVRDTVALGQCIGRKRLEGNDDYIDLIVKAHNGNSFRTLTTRAKKQCELAEYLIEHKASKFVQKYARRSEGKKGYYNVVYDSVTNNIGDIDKSTKQVNELVHYKAIKQLQEVNYMWDKGKSFMEGYCKYIAMHFDKYDIETNEYDYEIMEDLEHNDSLEKYLDSIVGEVMLQVKDRKELIEKLNIKQDGKLIRKKESINPVLEERGINYRIVNFQTSRMINGKKKNFKAAWKVMKMTG